VGPQLRLDQPECHSFEALHKLIQGPQPLPDGIKLLPGTALFGTSILGCFGQQLGERTAPDILVPRSPL
jgi:hypothetical protein